jgi:hypothetical protein
MRGAKSNALFLKTANHNPGCPCVALVPNSSNIVLYEGEMGERSLFRAVVTKSYLLILQGIASISCLILPFLLEPKWSQAR